MVASSNNKNDNKNNAKKNKNDNKNINKATASTQSAPTSCTQHSFRLKSLKQTTAADTRAHTFRPMLARAKSVLNSSALALDLQNGKVIGSATTQEFNKDAIALYKEVGFTACELHNRKCKNWCRYVQRAPSLNIASDQQCLC